MDAPAPLIQYMIVVCAIAFGDGRWSYVTSVISTPDSGDLCFITSTPIEEVVSELKSFGIAIEEGPALRTGATGSTMSVSNYAT
jgi:hypothetical protein